MKRRVSAVNKRGELPDRVEERIEDLARFPAENTNPVLRAAADGTIIYANEASLPLLGFWNCQAGQPLPPTFSAIVQDALNSGSVKSAEVDCQGRVFSLTFTPIRESGYVNIYGLEITDHKRLDAELVRAKGELEVKVAERTDQLTRAIHKLRQEVRQREELERDAKVHNTILKFFLEASSLKEYLDRAGRLLRQSLGCRCLGIRAVDEEENIPYVWQEGFSPEFLATESLLSLRRDQCACIRIITGGAEPQDAPAITPAGSFCCNDMTGFIGALTAEQESRFRGMCVRAGFETVAVIPIRHSGKALGAIHIADERKGALPPKKLQLVESIAPLIGEAVYRFHVEQELRQNEAGLAEAQRIAHVGNWDWDIVTDELRWSDEIYRIFGLSPQQFGASYQAFLTYIHPDDRGVVQKSVNGALYEGKPYDIDHRIVLPDGSVRVVHENGEVAFDENGRPVRMVGTVHDITEHKLVEEQLRGLSRRLVEIQEEERRTIARDLHDQVGQSLTMLGISIERSLRSPEGKMRSILADTKALVKELMNQVREMSLNLRPSILDDLGLLPALTWHFERFATQTNIKVDFRHSGLDIEFPWDIRTAAYRIVQEALGNVARHAGATEVTVRASVVDKRLSIHLEDHGVGFDAEKVAATSSGISGMEERARLLGGSLTVDSAPGIGTHVTLELPLPSPPVESTGISN